MTGMIAPMVLDGSINGEWFEAYAGMVLVPDPRRGDVVIMANLSSHMLRKAGERTVSGLWSLAGKPVNLFQPQECANQAVPAAMTRTERKPP